MGGDSAGGSLSCAVTILAMKNGLSLPKGLQLVYPSLDVRRNFFGSKRNYLTDTLLWPSVAKVAY